MSGKDCNFFRKDKCKGMNCPSYNTCPIQWGTLPEGMKPDDYNKEDF